MTETILLPVDGSDRSDRAVDYALDRAAENGVVHALYVVDTGRYGEPALSSAEAVVDEAEDEGHRRLAEVVARGHRRNVDVTPHCCHGRPAEELLSHARETDADVVVSYRRVPHVVRTQLADAVETVVTEPDPATVA